MMNRVPFFGSALIALALAFAAVALLVACGGPTGSGPGRLIPVKKARPYGEYPFIERSTVHIPALVEIAQYRYDRVVATRFINPPHSPFRSLLRWDRCSSGTPDVELAFRPRVGTVVIDKTGYSCVDRRLLDLLHTWNVERVDVCGIDTDACVMASALDLFQAGIVPRVRAAVCASSGGPEYHALGLTIIARAIGSEQVA